MLNLVKLCVGASSIDDLKASVERRSKLLMKMGFAPEYIHTTRMTPKRADELLDGGSLYWVIKGKIQVRQEIIAIRPFEDEQGIKRCDIALSPVLVPTKLQARRAFQGWRYLTNEDVPEDLQEDFPADEKALEVDLTNQLEELGLL